MEKPHDRILNEKFGAVLPIIILFASFQKYFIRGIALTGIKA